MKPENCYVALLLIIFFGVLGCKKKANISPKEHPPKLVVNSIFTHTEQLELFVYSSKNYNEVDPVINDLNVDMYSHQFTKKANINYFTPQITSDFYPDPIYTGFYHVNVSAEGYDSVYAVTKIPKPIIASATKVGDQELYNTEVAIINIEITDDPIEDDYYMINSRLIKVHTTTGVKSADEYWAIYSLDQRADNEVFTQNRTTKYSNVYLADKNVERDSAVINSTVYIENGKYVNTLGIDSIFIQVRVRSVEEDFYKHALNIDQYEQQLLAEPGFEKQYIKIHSNITNGLGIFAGYSEKTFNFQVYP